MQAFNKGFLIIVTSLLLTSSVQAFSFSMSDHHHPRWHGYPYWASPYWAGPGYAPWHMPPRLSGYDRLRMKHRRQRQMDNHEDAMESLNDMLFGGFGFDREKAIKLARKIQSSSGAALSGNFHRGSIATSGSRAAPSIWGNEESFKANAKVLQETAKALALELGKRPTAEEGAVFLKTGAPYKAPKDRKDEPVSPAVWEKFNDLSDACFACHMRFRGYEWD